MLLFLFCVSAVLHLIVVSPLHFTDVGGVLLLEDGRCTMRQGAAESIYTTAVQNNHGAVSVTFTCSVLVQLLQCF